MLVHMELDNENKINGMCMECRQEMEKDKCNNCGKVLTEYNINESFDAEKFEKLKNSYE